MISHALDLTGAPLCLLELTLELARRGVLEATVAAPADGPLRERFEGRGVPVTILPHGELADAAALGRRLEMLGVELLCASTLRMFHAVDAARRHGIPSVWTIRESEPWQTCYSDLPEPVARAALGCFAAPYRVVFDSYACRAMFDPLNSRHNFSVIHTGLPPDRLSAPGVATREEARRALGLEADAVVLVTVGTVCERKGQQDLVQALRRMPADATWRLRCFIVGDRPGPYSDELSRLVSALSEPVRSRVHVLPETPEVGQYLHAADVFVCTSRVESYPRVTLEAMSAGLPIVSTPVVGLSEQLRDGINAIFYEPGDTHALADALTAMAGNDGRRRSMGCASPAVLAGLLGFDEMVDVFARTFREAAESSVIV